MHDMCRQCQYHSTESQKEPCKQCLKDYYDTGTFTGYMDKVKTKICNFVKKKANG